MPHNLNLKVQITVTLIWPAGGCHWVTMHQSHFGSGRGCHQQRWPSIKCIICTLWILPSLYALYLHFRHFSVHYPTRQLVENVALSQIGVVIVGARMFSEHLQSSKMSKTNGLQYFFNLNQNLGLVPNELSRDFQRT
jgi:hypothetical protein